MQFAPFLLCKVEKILDESSKKSWMAHAVEVVQNLKKA
jgi:hypothetical protein